MRLSDCFKVPSDVSQYRSPELLCPGADAGGIDAEDVDDVDVEVEDVVPSVTPRPPPAPPDIPPDIALPPPTPEAPAQPVAGGPRRSTRARHAPSYLKDYVVDT